MTISSVRGDCLMFFFFKQKTAYELRISDWSSDVCSSDLRGTCRSANPGAPSPRQVCLQRRCGRHVCRHLDRCLQRSRRDRKSVVSGKSVSVRVDLGGRRILKKKKTKAQDKEYMISYEKLTCNNHSKHVLHINTRYT